MYYKFELNSQVLFFVNMESENEFVKTFFEKFGLVECEEKDKKISIEEKTLIVLKDASPMLAKRIGSFSAENKYGDETVQPYGDFNLYKYRGVGMLMIPHQHNIWEMAITGSTKEGVEAKLRAMLMRVLSFVLAPFDIVGTWGVPVDEGMVLLSQKDSNGEAVFVDLDSMKLLTVEGEKDMTSPFEIIKLDKNLKNNAQSISKEELIGTLTHHCTYFSFQGIPYNLKGKMMDIANMSEAILYPFDHFEPRKDKEVEA
jgi:hypothetical protein